jgi:hypothetical protein
MDIEPGLSIPRAGGSVVQLEKGLLDPWKVIFHNPFFISAVLESEPSIQGRKLIGMGLAVLVASEFADSEIESPSPDIASRVLASIRSQRRVLLTWQDVARANASDGVDVVILHCAWHDHILNPRERHDVQTLLASSLAQVLAGFRIHRILSETTSEPVKQFHHQSIEYRLVAEFPQCGRALYLMNRESGTSAPGSIGNVIFRLHDPMLRLRASDQELLVAALSGATDSELSRMLGVSSSAVKARWRSTFAQIAEVMPDLVTDADSRDVRGLQKRHRVLGFVRDHPVELRPYHWARETK